MLLRHPRAALVVIGIVIAVAAGSSFRVLSRYEPLDLLGQSGFGGTQPNALEADDVQIIGRSGGRRSWRLAAQTVTLSQDRRVVSISGIRRGALYTANGTQAVSLTADRATYQTPFGMLGVGSAGLLQVQGHVRAEVLTPAHPLLTSEQIVWDSQSNALSSPGAVTATLPKLSVSAGSAVYSSPPGAPAHGTMHLTGGVQARFVSTRGVAALNCPGLTWSADGQTAQSVGLVTAQIPGGLGTARAADITVNTHTGDLTGHGFRGTLLLSREVQ